VTLAGSVSTGAAVNAPPPKKVNMAPIMINRGKKLAAAAVLELVNLFLENNPDFIFFLAQCLKAEAFLLPKEFLPPTIGSPTPNLRKNIADRTRRRADDTKARQ
jgi:hypothetical protein